MANRFTQEYYIQLDLFNQKCYNFYNCNILGDIGLKGDKKVVRSLTLITQFGINMLVPIFICSFVGIFLDRKLGTDFLMIILFFVGAVSGGYNVYRMSKRFMKSKNADSPYMHGAKKNDHEKSDT